MAVQRVHDGESPSAVMDSYGLDRKSIVPWLRKAEAEGIDALAPRPRTGRKRELTPEEEQEVARWVTGGDSRQHGFDFGLWTREIVADLIEWRLGVELSVTSVGRLLHRQGVTPQKPVRRPLKGATLLEKIHDLGIQPSPSRPRVSNDNAYSEGLFRTCKYVPNYPTQGLADLDAARSWVDGFVCWYNGEHRHSAIRYVTRMRVMPVLTSRFWPRVG